ncbi:MAG: polyprenyl synthetase family protein [Chloroflexaceae bacterium]|nr:polyprenyl synthetase family protein [Chloroflexaceae bacterium]
MRQVAFSPTLSADLQQVEQIIHERTRARAAVISVAGSHLSPPDVPRLRAALVLLAAQTASYHLERVIHAAAAVELIHAATQTHNDLVDEAERRRGQPRVGPWNHGVALMVGDYLFALAAGEMALSPDPRVIIFFSEAVKHITEGILMPAAPLQPLEEGRARHLERIGHTDAALIVAACKAGAAAGGADAGQIEILGRFGHELGLALRLGDEARDFTERNGSAAPGASLRAGAVTLPLIFAAALGDGARLTAALDSDDAAEQSWAVDEVRRHGLAPTRAEVLRCIEDARGMLAQLPPGPGREALARVADYAVHRAA